MNRRNIPKRIAYLIRDHPIEAVRVALGLAAIFYAIAMLNANTAHSLNYVTALWFFSPVQWCVLLMTQGGLTIYFTIVGYRNKLPPIVLAWAGVILWAMLSAARMYDGAGPDAVITLVLFSLWSAVRWQMGGRS